MSLPEEAASGVFEVTGEQATSMPSTVESSIKGGRPRATLPDRAQEWVTLSSVYGAGWGLEEGGEIVFRRQVKGLDVR